MNRIKYLFILIYSFLALSCSINLPRSTNSTASPTIFSTNVLDTTSTPHVITTTIPPTLLPKTAKETIQTLLQEPIDCLAPCMWGITPHTTNIEEAINKYMQFGMKLNFVSEKGSKKYYETNYGLPSGLFILHMITAKNGVVTSTKINITTPKNTQRPREWLAYSPEMLIKWYGEPSKVDFLLARIRDTNSQPIAWYTMDLFFEKSELIVEYGNSEILYSENKTICPLLDQYETVTLWFGSEAENQPRGGTPLSEATNIQMRDFTELMTGTSNDACFELNVDIFP